MGLLLEMLKAATGEAPLFSALGKWRQTVSDQLDQLLGSEAGGGLGYLTQTAWFVDSVAGNDANDGTTSSTAIQTLAELSRRWNGRTFAPSVSAVTVKVTGNFQSETLRLNASFANTEAFLDISGSMTQVGSGTVTAYTGFTPAAGTRAQLTDAAQDFTAHFRRRLRITSGTSNTAVSFVCSTAGATVANIGQFRTQPTLVAVNGTLVNPAVGSSYVVETYNTVIREYDVNCSGAFILLHDFQISPAVATRSLNRSAVQGSTRFHVFGCDYIAGTALMSTEGDHFYIACSIRGSNTFEFRQPGQHFYKSMCFFTAVTQSFGCTGQTSENVHDGNGTDNVTLFVEHGAVLEEIGHRGFFGCINGGGGTALAHVSNSSQWMMIGAGALFWGAAGNTATNALEVENGSGVSYTTKPTATANTPGSDVVLAGAAAIAWAAVPAISASPDNAFVNVKH